MSPFFIPLSKLPGTAQMFPLFPNRKLSSSLTPLGGLFCVNLPHSLRISSWRLLKRVSLVSPGKCTPHPRSRRVPNDIIKPEVNECIRGQDRSPCQTCTRSAAPTTRRCDTRPPFHSVGCFLTGTRLPTPYSLLAQVLFVFSFPP